MTRDEFIRRAEALHIERAELVGGRVYIMAPMLRKHARSDGFITGVFMVYAAATPGCEVVPNATCFVGEDAPQPDSCLRILKEFGGASSEGADGYIHGAPELVAEICETSANYDLHDKLELYQTNGVKEYVAILLRKQEIRWHLLVSTKYQRVPVPQDHVFRSVVFPGLWLDSQALLAGDSAKLLAVLNAGLASPEHAAFVRQLENQKRPG